MSDSPLKLLSVRLLLICGFLSLAVAAFAAVQLNRSAASPDFQGTAYPDTPPAPDFTLTAHDGEPRKLSDFRGKTALIFFGFTNCPDVCPLTLASLSRVIHAEELDEEVQVLLVSVDPERDTPERLKEYVTAFGPAVMGLTGTQAEIDAVQSAYGIYAAEVPSHDGTVTLAHTTQVFGVDRNGRLRVLIHAEEGDDVVRKDLLELIRVGSEEG